MFLLTALSCVLPLASFAASSELNRVKISFDNIQQNRSYSYTPIVGLQDLVTVTINGQNFMSDWSALYDLNALADEAWSEILSCSGSQTAAIESIRKQEVCKAARKTYGAFQASVLGYLKTVQLHSSRLSGVAECRDTDNGGNCGMINGEIARAATDWGSTDNIIVDQLEDKLQSVYFHPFFVDTLIRFASQNYPYYSIVKLCGFLCLSEPDYVVMMNMSTTMIGQQVYADVVADSDPTRSQAIKQMVKNFAILKLTDNDKKFFGEAQSGSFETMRVALAAIYTLGLQGVGSFLDCAQWGIDRDMNYFRLNTMMSNAGLDMQVISRIYKKMSRSCGYNPTYKDFSIWGTPAEQNDFARRIMKARE